MAEDKNKKNTLQGQSPNERGMRVEEPDTSEQEMRAGHIIPGADPPKNEHQRGGFGNRDGKEGFGSDTAAEGPSATGLSEYADDGIRPGDNIRTEEEGRGT
ncbi:hypothetical protein CLV24_103197 [Pontibacter ummariensis]|uniref:Uncharacterized protein n=1 Tax=Pontibacter ummariensis TaxID=1610492 RepID=A0A239CKP3_9BACT|nr:hypothetical protein [Pontibacter ummariensis]PRY14958.1 hypothetical protein CLV24_103197 [Pontibacter ummariensis]SNS20727.1 hypothetical protein SAMN06296052_103116 [Pontibacter ummariensis]